jgi:hypothetical protein
MEALTPFLLARQYPDAGFLLEIARQAETQFV